MHAKSQWRWSPEFRRLVGFSGDDTKGFPDTAGSWADRLHHDDSQATFDAFSACLSDKSGRTGYDVTYRLKMKDGSYRWFRAIGGVSRNAAGIAERACGSLIDIHDQKTGEIEIGRQVKLLEKVGEIANTLAIEVGSSAGNSAREVLTIASATEELAASLSDITGRVNQSAQAATQASKNAGITAEIVESLVGSVGRISNVLQLIDGIAAQTNLLALNATIEAARAGEAGKGFAVVANEVKQLASQSAQATREIADQISSVQQEAQRAVDAIRDITEVVNNAQDIASNIAEAVAQQDGATQEIAQRANTVSDQTSHVATVIETMTGDIKTSLLELKKAS